MLGKAASNTLFHGGLLYHYVYVRIAFVRVVEDSNILKPFQLTYFIRSFERSEVCSLYASP